MTSGTTFTSVRLKRLAVVGLGTASIAFAAGGLSATVSAAPDCANSPVGSPTRCCVKVGNVPGPGPDCTSNQPSEQGLLGGAPVVGNLPGLGGVL